MIFGPTFQKKWREPACNGLPPFSYYKDNTFSTEIQIVLTLRNTPSNVKMQRCAATNVWQVLSYEVHIAKMGILQRKGHMTEGCAFIELVIEP